jgi:DNA-binding response OmpR family regulator
MQTTKLHPLENHKLDLMKVLLIEDDSDTAEVVRIFLSMNGYRVHVEPDAMDIIAMLEKYSPDLLIVDYLLPFINGGELCAIVKNDTSWNHLPVIIYSAYPKVINSLGNYHCDAFLSKPFELAGLIDTVETTLFKRSLLPKTLVS